MFRKSSKKVSPFLFPFRLGLAGFVLTVAVIGCTSYLIDDHSVRFAWKNYREAGLLPPLKPYPQPKTVHRWYSNEFGDDIEPAPTSGTVADWKSVRDAVERNEPAAARPALKRILADFNEEQKNRNAAIDLEDALSALGQGCPKEKVAAYFQNRLSWLEEKEVQAPPLPDHPALRDNVAYFEAAKLYRDEEFKAAADAFGEIATKFPGSEKREAALFMNALATLKTFSESGNAPSSFEKEREKVVFKPDGPLARAKAGFERVRREYPRGRFQEDARGWLAYLNCLAGKDAEALIEYYRLLASDNPKIRREALVSLSIHRPRVPETDMVFVERTLAREPAAAFQYAYHELFNFTPYLLENEYFDPRRAEEMDRKRKLETEQAQALKRVIAFARQMIDSGDSRFRLRLAMGQLVVGERRAALENARRSLRVGLPDAERHRALWVAGAAALRLDRRREAFDFFSQLITAKPEARLEESARRQLAMVAEELGDFNTALEQYFAMDYWLDAAYLIDVLMPPEQIQTFLSAHPNHPKTDALNYSIGIRYLRSGKYAEARAALGRVKTWLDYSSRAYWGEGNPCPKCDTFDSKFRPFRHVQTSWVTSDFQTIQDLERLEGNIRAAGTDEARAEAMYQLAGYLYSGCGLNFYNPALWCGFRAEALNQTSRGDHFKRPNEEELLWSYSHEHESVARSLAIFLEVSDSFPKTKASPDALYSAVIAQQRLENFNGYWRSMVENGRIPGPRKVTFRDVRRTYPKYIFPRDTDGWEPMTRTVNGHAAWPPKPKPVPPKPFHIRAWNKAGKGWGIVSLPLGRAWTWTTGLLGTFFGFVFRLDLFLYFAGLAFASWFFGFRAQRTFIQRLRELPPGNEPPPPTLLLPDFNLTTALGLRYFKFPIEVRDDWWSRLVFSLRWIGWWSRTRQGVTILSHAMLHGGFAASIWWLCELVWK